MASIIIRKGETPELEKRILEEIEIAFDSVAPVQYRLLELIMKHRQEILDVAVVLKFGDREVRKCANWYEVYDKKEFGFMKHNDSYCMTFDEAIALAHPTL